MKYTQLADPFTTKINSNIVLTVKRWEEQCVSKQNIFQLKTNAFIYVCFTGKGKRIMFEDIENEGEDNAALHGDDRKGKDKEDEFKEVFCDKKRLI